MKKRGQAMSTRTVMGLIFAAAIILISYVVITSLSDIFISSADEQSALNNFNVLTDTVNKLMEDPERLSTKQIPYSIPNGYILVGFDKDWHGDLYDGTFLGHPLGTLINGKTEASACHDEGIDKPAQCQNKACLCLYEDTDGDDFKEDNSPDVIVTPCVTFDNLDTISAPADNFYDLNKCENDGIGADDYDKDCYIDGQKKYPQENPFAPISNYEFLVIYGSCGSAWGIKNIYIEKFTIMDQSKTHLFISYIDDETGLIKERMDKRKSSYTSNNP